ncbi:MAG: DUF559 domain-containing protein [Pirellulaceae bacterium]|nr:DUF559 domain-containing protein [Pirellulaceae bacterium]
MPNLKPSNRDPEQIAFAREQRQQANEFAQDVWQMVRNRKILSEKFRREYPVGPYTLDFVCLELKLNVEIDGKDHLSLEGRQRDSRRDAYMRELGFEVLRIHGFRVTQDPMSVRDEIEATVRELQLR